MKVIFAIPSITGTVRTETMLSVVQAVLLLWSKGIEADIHTLNDCPYLPVARNTLEAQFMADPDATDHFWIDYDMGFPAEAVLDVLERPEEIVGGAYRVKLDDESYSVAVHLEDGSITGKVIGEQKALVKADFLATGFLRIKRGVYQRMREAYPELRYEESVIKTVNHPVKEAYDLFGMGVHAQRQRFTTEDYSFCQRWRDIGGELWIYPDITFDHIGKKAYRGNFHEFLRKEATNPIDKALAIPGWMTENELRWLAASAKTHHNIVEIGSWMGRSTVALAENTAGKVTAVDTWEGSSEHQQIMRSMTPDAIYLEFIKNTASTPNVKAIRMTSMEAAKALSGERFDMIFIDGAHDYKSVKDDIEAWLPLLDEGGMICGHDLSDGWPELKQAVMESLPRAETVPGTSIWTMQMRREPSSGDLDAVAEEQRIAEATCR